MKIKGFEILLDDDDYSFIARLTWHVRKVKQAHYATGRFYIGGKYRTVNMHQLIVGFSKQIIDHINGNGLDNRKENLRFVTAQQNAWNRRCNNKHGFIGVSKSGNQYYGRLRNNGVEFCSTGFPTPIEAAKAYDELAIKHRGAYARLNFKEGNDEPG